MLTAEDLAHGEGRGRPGCVDGPGRADSECGGQIARTDLAPGVVLSPALVVDSHGFVAGRCWWGWRCGRDSYRPREWCGAAGPDRGDPRHDAPRPGAGGVWASAAFTGVVVSSGEQDTATGVTVADVRVPAGDAAKVARLASTGNVAVLALPVGE